MTVGSVYGGATRDDPQELLNTARHHCQAIQTIIDQLTETKSNTELRPAVSFSRSAEKWRRLMEEGIKESLPGLPVVLIKRW